MKTWLTPTAVEDKFIPNEAVSVEHKKGGCGTYSNQTLTVKNGILTNIKEGTLNGHLYQDSNYTTEVEGLSINDGTKIYWTTVSGDRTWHHQGKIIEVVDHKTMS